MDTKPPTVDIHNSSCVSCCVICDEVKEAGRVRFDAIEFEGVERREVISVSKSMSFCERVMNSGES